MMETVEREKNKNWWKITERGRKRAENSARQKKKLRERKEEGGEKEKEKYMKVEKRKKEKRKWSLKLWRGKIERLED